MAVSGANASIKVASNPIAGLNDTKITVNGNTIDVTTFASGGWIEKIQGLKDAKISMSGFYLSNDTQGQTVLQNALMTGTSVAVEALLDGTTGWSGSFLVTSFDDEAKVAGEVTRSINLESTGALTTV